MKAQQLVFPSKLKVEIETVELPDAIGDDDVLIEGKWGLISPGTELAMYTETHVGFPIPDFKYAKFPFRPGYVGVGKVLKAGKKVSRIKEGDMVYHRGNHASHVHSAVTGRVYPLGTKLSPELASFAALADIALTSVRLSQVHLGQTVAVFGLGMIGNLAGQLMKCAGARKVIGIDTLPERLEIARQCGFDEVVNPKECDLQKSIKDLTSNKGCQVVVEATGNPQVAGTAMAISAEMGKVILLGSPRGKAEIDLYFSIHRPGISVIGAHGKWLGPSAVHGDPDTQELMLEFVASGRLNVKPLLSHTLPASQAEAAYQGLLNDGRKYLGVLLDLQKWK